MPTTSLPLARLPHRRDSRSEQPLLRLGELSRLGFTRVLIPHQGSAKVLPPEGMTVVRVKNIRQAIDEALED